MGFIVGLGLAVAPSGCGAVGAPAGSCSSTSPIVCDAKSGVLSVNTPNSLAAGTYDVIVDTNASKLCSFYVDAQPTTP